MKQHKDFKVIIEQNSGGQYFATVPDLPNCRVEGDSVEMVKALIKVAIKESLGAKSASIRLETLNDKK